MNFHPEERPEVRAKQVFTAAAVPAAVLMLLALAGGCGPFGPLQGAAPGRGSAGSGSAEFTSSRYLTAKASGRSEPEARRRALSALSAIFESEIESSVKAETRSVFDSRSGESLEKEVEESIMVESAVRLEGAEIGNAWKSGGCWHAVAVLDRLKARHQWIEELESINSGISGRLRAFETLESPVLKLRAARRIFKAWVEARVIKSRLRVIGADYEGGLEPDIRALAEKLPVIRSSIRIFLDVSGEHASEVRDRIAGVLTEKGYVLAFEKEEADAVIQASVRVEPVALDREEWRFVRAGVSAFVLDTATGHIAARISENSRAAHLNEKEAARKAVKEASGKAAQQIAEQFEASEEQPGS